MKTKSSKSLKTPEVLVRTAKMLVSCACLLLGSCQSVAPAVLAALPAESATPAPTATDPDQDHIRITKYPNNFTAFKIEIQNGPTIITDPYDMDEEIHADIVTESHSHYDHTDVSRILQPYELFDNPGNFEVAGVRITGVGGTHDKPLMNPYSIANTNIIYVFDLGNIRLAQFGSQGEFPTNAMFDEIGQVDVLIVQVFNKANKMNISEISQVMQRLSAKIVIPAHGDPSLNEQLAEKLGADFKKELSGILELSESDLDQLKTPVVLVLDH